MVNPAWDFRDQIWPASNFDIATVAIFEGKVEQGMRLAKEVCDNFAEKYRDQWNWTDCYDGGDGHPTANSHYMRQLNLLHIVHALAGFQYDASSERLGFEPAISPPFKLPFLTPTCLGSYIEEEGQIRLELIEGELKLKQLFLPIRKPVSDISLPQGAEWRIEDQRLIVDFKEPLTLSSKEPFVLTLVAD
jgi:hypothetical protein